MRRFSFYHHATGIFHPSSFGTDDPRESVIKSNTPAAHVAIEGEHDPLSQRVDVQNGKVIDYQPPQPSSDHEWNTQTLRWQLTPAAQAKADLRRAALAQIATLEAKQPRVLREAVLGHDGGMGRLRALDEQIERLRAEL